MSDATIREIAKLAELLRDQQALVSRLEDELAAAKALALRYEREDIPNAMLEAGVTELRLDDGSRISVTEDCSARITDATRNAAISWLVDNGFGGIVKTEVAVQLPRGEREAAAAIHAELVKTYPEAQLKETVHPSTLKAFVKEQLEKGAPVPFDLFNVHTFNKAVLRKGDK